MIYSLQSLRFVFIFLVVISHFFHPHFEFGGACGVSFFFVLSGFVLSFAYSGKIEQATFRTGPFVRKQFCKVYPLHILTLLFMLLLDMRLGQNYPIYVLIPNILMLQSWIPDRDFFFVANGSSWFLCDVMFFYAVFATCFTRFLRASLRQLASLAVAVSVIYCALLMLLPESLVTPILYANPLLRFIDFAVGILLYRFSSSSSGRRWRDRLAGLPKYALTLTELALVVGVILLAVAYHILPERVRTVSLYWPVIPAFVLYYAMMRDRGGALTNLLNDKRMIWVGSISFEMYLVHMPVFRIVNSVLSSFGLYDLPPLRLTVSLLAVFLASWLAKKCVTAPAYRLLMKKL